MNDQARRATDNVNHQSFSISQLIASEEDERQRTMLLVIHEMSQSNQTVAKAQRDNSKTMDSLAESVKALTDQFAAHAKAQDDLISQGKVWKQVVVWALGIVQVTIVAAVGYQYNDSKDLHGEQSYQGTRIQKLEDASKVVHLLEGRRDDK